MNILVDATDLSREDAVEAAQAVYLLKTLEARGLKFLLAEDDATDGEEISFCKPPDAMKAFIKENPEEFERIAGEQGDPNAVARVVTPAVLPERPAAWYANRIESSYKGPACACGTIPHFSWCPAAR